MSEYIIGTTNMPEHVREILEPWIIGSIVRCRDREYAERYDGKYICYESNGYMSENLDKDYCSLGADR